MAEIRLSKLIKQFNIGLDTLVEFLNSKGAGIEDANPNLKVSEEFLPELHKKFGKDMELKEQAEKVDVKLTEILDKASKKQDEEEDEFEPERVTVIKSNNLSRNVEPEPVAEPEPEPVAEPEPAAPAAPATPVAEDNEKQPEDKDNDKGVVLPFPEDFEKTDDKPVGKKKSHRWIWIVLLILVLLAAAGACYWYLLRGRLTAAEPEPVAQREHLEGVGAVNSLTYNCDMINYTGRDIMRHSELVNRFMAEYIDLFTAEQGYTSARVPLMDRVRNYSSMRMSELLGPRFAVQYLIPYNDYIYHYNEPFLKETNGKRARVEVQRELMDGQIGVMLQQVVDELGLQPDANSALSAAAVQQAKQAERKAMEKNTESEPMNVYVEKGSKQGFDVIAGFYLDRNTAARMAGRLHSLGCDAYIIEFNDLYYVSMGSANSQTAADALYKHIKSWYDGDVAIKKW